MRCILAGESAEAWGRLAGMRPRRANLSSGLSAVVGVNQKAAARVLESQDAEWRQIARDRREIAQIEAQLADPHRERVAQVTEDPQRGFNLRCGGTGKQDEPSTAKKKASQKEKVKGRSGQVSLRG